VYGGGGLGGEQITVSLPLTSGRPSVLIGQMLPERLRRRRAGALLRGALHQRVEALTGIANLDASPLDRRAKFAFRGAIILLFAVCYPDCRWT